MKKASVFLYRYPFFLFLLFLLIAFLPVLLPSFYIKNDLVTQILPTRFIISESIHSGYYPWWNPYINYGIPQYGDMNCGFWNPLLWAIAWVFGYNIWSITFEELFYIFLCGWGMYVALRELKVEKKTSTLSGMAYMCSGYIIGHMQHFCWITGAAFLPFVFLYFVRINKNPSLKNFLTGALCGFMFLSATHPGIVIGSLYFFSFCVLGIFLFKQTLLKSGIHQSIIRNNIIFLSLTIFLSLCIIISYSEVVTNITRGEKLPDIDTVANATTFQSYISLLLPLVVHKSTIFNTDISMRNMYIGLFSLFGIFFYIKSQRRAITLYTIFCLLFFVLLSSGGVFKTISNAILPLAAYVRSAGEFSIFTIFILIVIGALGLNSNLSKIQACEWSKALKKALLFFSAILAFAVVMIVATKAVFFLKQQSIPLITLKEKIKYFLTESSIWELLLIQSAINLLLIYLTAVFYKHRKNRIPLLFSLNLVLITWLTLPFTGVGTMSRREVDAVLMPVPKGIHNQPLIPLNVADTISLSYSAFTGLPYTYKKMIGTPEWNPYPILLSNSFAYFNSSSLKQFINSQSFLFLSKDTTTNTETEADTAFIHIKKMGPGVLKAEIKNNYLNYITFLQNDYPYWKVLVNGKQVSHITSYKTFISAAVPKGDFTIEFVFEPQKIVRTMWLNLALLTIATLIILFQYLNPVKLKNNFQKT